ncbi:hypothetical protein SAMN04515695_5862 [Pseudovibrio sp. Tun.PSC04-5.I4]|nr:hypothetical protein SAMN04515695_5862 [Pseudovibrio sp. Tun.PSC04-5.I4]
MPPVCFGASHQANLNEGKVRLDALYNNALPKCNPGRAYRAVESNSIGSKIIFVELKCSPCGELIYDQVGDQSCHQGAA